MPVSLEIMEKIKKEFVTDPASMEEVTGSLFSFFFFLQEQGGIIEHV